VVGAVVGLGLAVIIANAMNSSEPATGPVPNTEQAANDAKNPDCQPNDCPERQKRLEVRYGGILLLIDKGFRMTIAKKVYNKDARAHNKVCSQYPVPTFIDVVQ
jgi:hypothetical protein